MNARASSWVLAAALIAAAADARADDDWLGRDKALHFGFSVAMASGAYSIAALKLDPIWQRAAIGAGFSLAVGAGKEAWDLAGHGDPSWKDFAWDAIGTAVGVGVAIAVDAITRGAAHDATGAAASGLVVRF